MTTINVGYDPTFKMQCLRSWWTHPDIVAYDNMTDDVYQAYNGKHRKISTEVEFNTAGSAFAAQLGAPGQAYHLVPRTSLLPASPAYLDFTAGSHAAGYELTMGWDFSGSTMRPISTAAFQWTGVCDYQDQGGATSFGSSFANFQSVHDFKINPRVDSNPAGVAVTSVSVSTGGTYTPGTIPTVSFTGTIVSGYAGATAHAVMNTAGTAVIAVIVDTPGTYTAPPTVAFTGGTPATGTVATGSGNLYRIINGLIFTYPATGLISTNVTNSGAYTPGVVPTVTVSRGGGDSTGVGATAHAVMTADGTGVFAVVIDTPGALYTANPTLAFSSGGAVASAAFGVYTFFGAIDFNIFIAPGFPKDPIYIAAAEPKVRACVQGVAPSYYGFASVDGTTYAGLGMAADNAWHTSPAISWPTVLTYLTTTVDKRVGAPNASTPNNSSTTTFMPAPLGGMNAVTVKGMNYAEEANVPTYQNNFACDLSMRNMACQVTHPTALTTSGTPITDALRPTQGDGRVAPDSSVGMWEATTNLIINGGFETNVTTGSAGDGVSTITRDTTIFKFGAASLKIFANNTTPFVYQSPTVPSSPIGTKFATSAWIYVPPGSTIIGKNLQMRTLEVAGNVNATVTKVAVAGWQRIVHLYTVSGSTQTAMQSLINWSSPTVSEYIYVDGWQMEQKAYATPYVETNGATAARTAATVAAPISVFSEAKGWIALRFRFETPPTGANQSIFVAGDGSLAANYINLYNTATLLTLTQMRNTSAGTSITAANVPAADVYTTAVIAWTNTGGAGNGTLSLSVNGGAFTTVNRPAAAGGTVWAANYNLGQSSGQTLDGDFLWVAAGTGNLLDADAATLNAYGNTDPTYAQLNTLNTYTATPTFLWTAEDTSY